MNLSIFTVFLKNRNFTSKIKRSKVTDYAALIFNINAVVLALFDNYYEKGKMYI